MRLKDNFKTTEIEELAFMQYPGKKRAPKISDMLSQKIKPHRKDMQLREKHREIGKAILRRIRGD